MAKQYWLVKSEPAAYSWADLIREKRTEWTGVRNYQARIHLNAMRKGDRVFFYESVTTKAVLGIAEVTRTAASDPTTEDPRWVSVEIKAVKALPHSVPLDAIKQEPTLAQIALIRQSRLSVMPLEPGEFDRIAALGQ